MKRIAIALGITFALLAAGIAIFAAEAARADDFGNGGGSGGAAASGGVGGARSVYRWAQVGGADSTWTLFPTGMPVTNGGGGTKAQGPATERPSMQYQLPATANTTNFTLTAAIVQPAWLPKATTTMRVGSVTNIGHLFLLDNNSGTCNFEAPASGRTIPAATMACTTTFAGILVDSRSGSPSDFWCCSGNGTSGTCTAMGMTISPGATSASDYSLTIDMTTANSLTCKVNATSVTKSNTLPPSSTLLTLHWSAVVFAASATTGPSFSSPALEYATN